MGADPAETARAVERVRPLTDQPLIVKLTPNATEPAAVARGRRGGRRRRGLADQHAQGDGARPAHARSPGSAAAPAASPGPRCGRSRSSRSHAVASAVGIPVIGMGGIASGRHAADFLAAGAACVAVGTESFRDPAAGARIGGRARRARRPLRGGRLIVPIAARLDAPIRGTGARAFRRRMRAVRGARRPRTGRSKTPANEDKTLKLPATSLKLRWRSS